MTLRDGGHLCRIERADIINDTHHQNDHRGIRWTTFRRRDLMSLALTARSVGPDLEDEAYIHDRDSETSGYPQRRRISRVFVTEGLLST